MTFGEHLEELRTRIIIALVAFVVTFSAALVFQDELFAFFARPFERARAALNQSFRDDWAKEAHPLSAAASAVGKIVDALERGKLVDANGLAELRALAKQLEDKPLELGPLQAISPGETIGAYMFCCLLASIVVAAPILLFQLWKFIAAGLYQHEKSLVMRVLPFSLALFAIGVAFGYYVLAEMSVRFLVGYGDLRYVRPQVTVDAYLGLLFLLLLVMGLVFQVPLIMTVLSSVGLVQPATFRKKRRIFILVIFIVAAIITPPDYISQLLVAGPMLLLFELGILLASSAAKRRAERKGASE